MKRDTVPEGLGTERVKDGYECVAAVETVAETKTVVAEVAAAAVVVAVFREVPFPLSTGRKEYHIFM